MCCSSILCAGHHPLQQEIGVIRGTLHLHGMWYGEKGNFPLFVSPSCILLGDQAVFGPWGTVCSISMAVSRRFFSGVHPNIRANFPVPRVATALPSVPTPFSGRPNGVTLSSLLSTPSLLLGGRAFSALPCAGAPPPQRPPSYNMPRRPGVSIRNRCPVERVSPNHVPPVLCIPRRRRPCAYPVPQSTDQLARPGLTPAPQ